MINIESWFLIVLALVWIVIAVVQDLRKREVANWLNFSLIAIALSYRAFASVLLSDYRYLAYGIAGFAVFFALANLFYYSRIFAGGDAKLMMALGAVLPFYNSLYGNLKILLVFVLFFLFTGSIYGVVYSFFLTFRNRKKFLKEFSKQFKSNKKYFLIAFALAFAILVLIFIIREQELVFLSVLIALVPLIYSYSKAIEESCMIKSLGSRELTEGDWLYREIKIHGKSIKPSWEGLSLKELKLLKNYKRKVLIKEGIPFTPAFLFAMVALLIFIFYGS